MKCIFPIYIVENITNSTFSRNYYCFFIKLESIGSQNIF